MRMSASSLTYWGKSNSILSTSGLAIKIEDAVVTYREGVALDGVSLDVREGEFVGIIGPNGAGKTTLLKAINGLVKLEKGRVRVLGTEMGRHNTSHIRKRVGYVAQVRNLDPRLPISVRETVMIGAYGRLGLFHHPGPADRQRAQTVLETLGLARLAGRPLGHLSGGEQQKAAIARALVQDPQILLLDEPTLSLDREARREIVELSRSIHESRRLTTVFVTHDFEALPAACRRIIMMKDGRIWRQGEREVILDNGTLSELFAITTDSRAQR